VDRYVSTMGFLSMYSLSNRADSDKIPRDMWVDMFIRASTALTGNTLLDIKPGVDIEKYKVDEKE
jgi:hypothetical protein